MDSKRYHVWTEGCQMNVADSQRVGSSLEHLGYTFTDTAEEADVIVLNTCVVRQSAEDKALGRLSSLKPLKEKNPDLVINLMGCLVGVRGAEKLRAKLPMVDVFSPGLAYPARNRQVAGYAQLQCHGDRAHRDHCQHHRRFPVHRADLPEPVCQIEPVRRVHSGQSLPGQ